MHVLLFFYSANFSMFSFYFLVFLSGCPAFPSIHSTNDLGAVPGETRVHSCQEYKGNVVLETFSNHILKKLSCISAIDAPTTERYCIRRKYECIRWDKSLIGQPEWSHKESYCLVGL